MKKQLVGLSMMLLGLLAPFTLRAGDVYSVTADGQTFDAYFEDYDGQSWILIGRGRRDWEFDTDGQGNVDDVSQNLKAEAGFAPACYSDAIVNDLLSQAGATWPVEVRIMRATTIDGTGVYQDNRWTNLDGSAFTFDFDPGISVTHTIMNPGDTPVNEGSYTTANTSTKDNYRQGAGDGGARIFTFSHISIEAFRYGNQIGGSTAAGSFLYNSWPAPYTEVYIPYEVPAQGGISFSDLVSSNVTDTAASLYATANTNLTSATVVWDTEDMGDTNLLAWTGSATATGTTPGLITGNATSLTADTLYSYRFYGEDSSVPTNGWSSAETFATDLTAAQTPGFTSVTSSFNSVTLEWTDNAATETGYILQRSTNGVDFAVVAELDADTTTHEDSGLQDEMTYYYQLAATNTLNESGTDPAACATNATTLFMPSVTTYDGPALGWNVDTWNNAANWDAGIPSASQNAVILENETPTAYGDGVSATTPSYTGTLTLNSNSTMHVVKSYDAAALGSGVYMHEGSRLVLVHDSYTVPVGINLLGDASMKLSESTWGHHTAKTFTNSISGAFAMSFDGGNNNTYNLNVSNTYSSLSFENPNNSRIWANADGSLGTGDVTIKDRGTLIINATDAMADTATLSLSGRRDEKLNSAHAKLNMEQSDTIAMLLTDGFPRPAGTYGKVGNGSVDYQCAWILDGNGILTVTNAPADSTAPTVAFACDKDGETVFPGQPLTYTLTFSEPLEAGPETTDFENTAGPGITVESVTAVLEPGNMIALSYLVVVKASGEGPLNLGLKSSASVEDLFGNAVVVPVADDDTLTAGAPPPVKGQFGRWKPWLNGGINPATGVPWAVGDKYHMAFVSSVTRDATDPDIATYHAFVQAAADAAGMGDTTWYCIGQSFNDPSRDVNAPPMTTSLCIVLPDGETKLADDGADLSNGPDNYFNMYEDGVGTYMGGMATGAGRTFGDPGQSNIERGDSSRLDAAWWRVYNGSQTSQWHFYAISDELTLESDAPQGTLILLK